MSASYDFNVAREEEVTTTVDDIYSMVDEDPDFFLNAGVGSAEDPGTTVLQQIQSPGQDLLDQAQYENLTTESTSEPKKAFKDPALLLDDRILTNLLQAEMRYLPSTKYFDFQTDIQVWMRNKVAGWMLEVCVEQGCENDVFPTALNYVDRVLTVRKIDRTQLQLLGTTAMFMASKLKDTRYIPAHLLILYTDCSITLNDLVNWEMMVIGDLKWDLSSITPCDFLEQFLTRLPFSTDEQKTICRHANTFVSLCYATEFSYISYTPSMLAAACISTAAFGIKGSDWCRDNEIVYYLHVMSNVDIEMLKQLQTKIEKLIRDSQNQLNQRSDDQNSDDEEKSPNCQPATPTDVRDIQVM